MEALLYGCMTWASRNAHHLPTLSVTWSLILFRGTSLSSLIRASRVQGFQGPYGGSQLVLTLYRIYIFCFQMCNRLLELMKNGDAGIFPLCYSLKWWVWPFPPAHLRLSTFLVLYRLIMICPHGRPSNPLMLKFKFLL